jgi:tetratricopeptide (TPR) repeat protein
VEVRRDARLIGQVAGAMDVAAERGDVEALIELSARYDRLQTGRSMTALTTYATASYLFAPSRAIGQGMNVCAGGKDYAGVLKLIDFILADARRKAQQQTPGAAARSRRARLAAIVGAGTFGGYSVRVGQRYMMVRISYPQDNEYFGNDVIVPLRTAFELFKRDDLSSDLVNHFRRQAEAAAAPADAIYPRLALSAIFWWADARDEAVAELTKVVALGRPESELRMDLAGILMEQGASADAIELLDAVQPLDNVSLKRREELAITAAIAAGNSERAQHAAERLFGLRLDTDTQIRLSSQMHQLGLHDLADALLGRARRRAGGQSDALVGLMTQYQRQGKLEAAAQIAMQILRASRSSITAITRSVIDPEQARAAAMRVLATSGQLPKLIERTREQLKTTPGSVALHQMLADYYTAARQGDQAALEISRILELKPDDSELRLNLAVRLASSGDFARAISHYKAVFDKSPALAAESFFQMLLVFDRAGKTAGLVELMSGLDSKTLAMTSYSYISRLLQAAPTDSKTSLQTQKLFRTAWSAFPESHLYFVRRSFRDVLWRMPEAFDYACEVILPNPSSKLASDEYTAFFWRTGTANAPAAPKAENMVLQLLDLAHERGLLEGLLERIENARKQYPGWKTGGAFRALVLCRLGRYEEARALVLQAIDAVRQEPSDLVADYKPTVYWTLAVELEPYRATRDLAFAAYQACLSDPYSLSQVQYFPVTERLPIRTFVPLALQAGRRDEARRTLVELARSKSPNLSYAAELVTVMRMIALDAIGAGLIELGFSADAVPVLRDAEILSQRADLTISPTIFPGLPETPERIKAHLNAAIDQMSPSELAAIARATIAEARQGPTGTTPATGSVGTTGAPGLDLMTLVHPLSLDRAAVRSLVADSIEASDAAELAALAGPLELLRKAHPGELSVAICVALEALASKNGARMQESLDRLAQLVEKTPLDALGEGVKANARERAQAAEQIPLWLVARGAGRQTDPALRAYAGRFAARALEAARRQDDRVWLLAMLREQGESAFDRNDKNGAAAIWSRMLELVVTPAEARARRPAGGNRAGGPAPARAKAAGPEEP